MPRHVCLLMVLALAACDQPEPDDTTPPFQTHRDETTSRPVDASTGEDESTGGPVDDASTSEAAAVDESTGETTTSDADASTSASDASTGEAEVPCAPMVDVLLSIDVSSKMTGSLIWLASELPAIDAGLRAAGANVSWSVVPWVDMVMEVDHLSNWGTAGAMQSAQIATVWWSDVAISGLQPDLTHPDEEVTDAGLVALAAAADETAAGWRPGATRVVVHVTDSPLAEAPAVLSGFEITVKYEDVAAALVVGNVHVIAWAPADEPGYAAPFEEHAPLAAHAYDVQGEEFAAGFAAAIADVDLDCE